jgi:hypothetical protein
MASDIGFAVNTVFIHHAHHFNHKGFSGTISGCADITVNTAPHPSAF